MAKRESIIMGTVICAADSCTLIKVAFLREELFPKKTKYIDLSE